MATNDDNVSGDDRTSTTATADPASEPRNETTMSEPDRSGGGVLPFFLGGFLAAALGFLAAYYTEFGLFDAGEEDTALQESIEAQAARLDEIEAALGAPDETADRLAASEQSLAELRESISSVDSRLGGVELNLDGPPAESALDPEALEALSASTDEGLAALADQVAALDSRVSEIATQVQANTGGPTDEEVAALDQRMSELVAMVDERETELSEQFESQRAAIAEAEAAASAETSRISAQAGLSEIRAAIENGAPFQQAVGTIESAADVSIPDALTAVSDEGVATLAELQARFPEASRDGLAVAVGETAGDNPVDRFGAFLRAQTGARSLAETDGDTPDAILSRAAARLDEGNLDATLAELQALPEGGRAAMGDWIDAAQARVDAKAAVAELSQSLNTN